MTWAREQAATLAGTPPEWFDRIHNANTNTILPNNGCEHTEYGLLAILLIRAVNHHCQQAGISIEGAIDDDLRGHCQRIRRAVYQTGWRSLYNTLILSDNYWLDLTVQRHEKGLAIAIDEHKTHVALTAESTAA